MPRDMAYGDPATWETCVSGFRTAASLALVAAGGLVYQERAMAKSARAGDRPCPRRAS
jgi:hypothetical protein